MNDFFTYFNKLKEIKKEKNKFDKLIKKLEKENKKKEKSIKKNIEKLKNDNYINALKNMDVESLNFDKSGIRVNALKKNHINNMYQVSKLNVKKLMKLDGIGSKNAKQIYKNSKIIEKKLRENIKVSIDPGENKNEKRNKKIVNDTYVVSKNKQNINLLKGTKLNNETKYKKLLKNAKKINNPFFMIFKSEEDKKILYQNIDELEKFTKDIYKEKIDKVENTKKEISKMKEEDTWNEFKKNSSIVYSELENINLNESVISKKYSGIPLNLVNEIEKVNLNLYDLNVTLRPYQLFGTKYIINQEKVLLGDEMGLGKTMQAIATMCHLKSLDKTHFMVVAPLSVLVNWQREVSTHSNLKVLKAYGDDYEDRFNEWKNDGGVLVTTYETVKKLIEFELPQIHFITVDEAHYVKNPEAQRTKALEILLSKSERILFMTGTPIENNVDEMCFLVSLLQTNVAKEIEKAKSIQNSEDFKSKVAPVYLRRVREDVLTELPTLIEKEDWVVMNKEEIKAYKKDLNSSNFMGLRHVSWNVDDLENSEKAKRLIEICDEAKLNGRKVLIFTYFREVIEKVKNLLGDRCLTPITGQVKATDRQKIVDELEASPAGTCLIAQVLAGGVGLNIQSASVVIFCEPQLKPSMETQAIARSYRMGQTETVFVHRLLSDETVDERIMEILKNKQDIFDAYADESIIAKENMKLSEVNNMIEEQKKYWNEK